MPNEPRANCGSQGLSPWTRIWMWIRVLVERIPFNADEWQAAADVMSSRSRSPIRGAGNGTFASGGVLEASPPGCLEEVRQFPERLGKSRELPVEGSAEGEGSPRSLSAVSSGPPSSLHTEPSAPAAPLPGRAAPGSTCCARRPPPGTGGAEGWTLSLHVGSRTHARASLTQREDRLKAVNDGVAPSYGATPWESRIGPLTSRRVRPDLACYRASTPPPRKPG